MKFDAKTVFVHLKQADHVTQPDGAGDDDLWEALQGGGWGGGYGKARRDICH